MVRPRKRAARFLVAPATALMGRFRYSAKFALLGALAAIAIVLVIRNLYVSLKGVIETTTHELDGTRVLPKINRAVQLVQQHRGLSGFALQGDHGREAEWLEKREKVNHALRELTESLTPSQRSDESLTLALAQWEIVASRARTLTPTQSFDIHTDIANELAAFTKHLADESQLILDGYVDTYYLAVAASQRLPAAIESLGQIRAYGVQVLVAKNAHSEAKVRIQAYTRQLNRSLYDLNEDFKRVAKYNPVAAARLSSQLSELTHSSKQLADIVKTQIVLEHFQLSAETFYDQTTAEIDQLYEVLDIVIADLGRLLEQRIVSARRDLLTTILSSLFLFALVIYFAFGIYFSITEAVETIDVAALNFVSGNLDTRIKLSTKDELRSVSENFNKMASGFGELLKSHQLNEQRLQQLVDSSIDAIIQINKDNVITRWNPQATALFGWAQEEALQKSLPTLILPERLLGTTILDLLNHTYISPRKRLETTAKHRAGHEFPIEVSVSASRAGDPAAELTLFIRDLSGRSKAEEAVKMSALVFENSTEAMLITEPDGNILSVNRAFWNITGYSPEEVIGKTPRILASGRHDAEFFREMWQTLLKTGRWKGEVWNKKKNGQLYVGELTINTIFSEIGVPVRRVGMFSDITARKMNEERIWKEANFDSLTGLPNRRMFHHQLEREILKSKQRGTKLALFFIDLDRFKEVNDTLGHELGDRMLKEAAQRLVSCVRATDMVARLGGDEFTLIVNDLDSPQRTDEIALTVLERLRKPFQLDHEMAYVSASVGITICPTDGDSVDVLIRNADQAMYVAKAQGKNCYHYFTASMQEDAQKRLRLSGDLHRAVAEKEFRLHYQPIVELQTGRVRKAEALIRWAHPTRGLVLPGEFIALAEETRLIAQIDDWVFQEAAQQISGWRKELDPLFQVSVNCSPARLKQRGDAAGLWFEFLQQHQIDSTAMVIEITENQLMDAGADAALDRLIRYREAGIQVAIDDFGTGYSSLSYLRKLDVHYLKIDQTFVQALDTNSDGIALVEAIVVMAHKLGLKVVAEGIETQKQREILAGLGCDYGQGFVFSPALEPTEFQKLVRSFNATSSGAPYNEPLGTDLTRVGSRGHRLV